MNLDSTACCPIRPIITIILIYDEPNILLRFCSRGSKNSTQFIWGIGSWWYWESCWCFIDRISNFCDTCSYLDIWSTERKNPLLRSQFSLRLFVARLTFLDVSSKWRKWRGFLTLHTPTHVTPIHPAQMGPMELLCNAHRSNRDLSAWSTSRSAICHSNRHNHSLGTDKGRPLDIDEHSSSDCDSDDTLLVMRYGLCEFCVLESTWHSPTCAGVVLLQISMVFVLNDIPVSLSKSIWQWRRQQRESS